MADFVNSELFISQAFDEDPAGINLAIFGHMSQKGNILFIRNKSWCSKFAPTMYSRTKEAAYVKKIKVISILLSHPFADNNYHKSMLATKINDDELWSDLVKGSEKAFSILFSRYHSGMVNYGKSITMHHNIVGDCVQDVFADIWLYRKTLSTPDSVRAYLLSGLRKRIARKLERDPIFSRCADIETVEFSAPVTILDELITNEEMRSQVEYLNVLINQLPPRQKEALYLRYHQQLSMEQIADMMHMNYQSVVNLLHRAIKQLRSVWKGKIPQLMLLLTLLSI